MTQNSTPKMSFRSVLDILVWYETLLFQKLEDGNKDLKNLHKEKEDMFEKKQKEFQVNENVLKRCVPAACRSHKDEVEIKKSFKMFFNGLGDCFILFQAFTTSEYSTVHIIFFLQSILASISCHLHFATMDDLHFMSFICFFFVVYFLVTLLAWCFMFWIILFLLFEFQSNWCSFIRKNKRCNRKRKYRRQIW